MTQAAAVILVDFDGTITPVDSDFALADALLGQRAGPAMYGPLAAAYERLEIGMQAYFEAYLAGLNATPERIALTAARLPMRPGFADFARWCRGAGLALRILSEGLDLYIEPILRAHGLQGLPLSCNRAVRGPRGYGIAAAAAAASCGRCLNCKGAHVRRAKAEGAPLVALVGNGASDLCAARLADVVLARDSLASHCRKRGISYVPWTDFADVRAALSRFAPNP